MPKITHTQRFMSEPSSLSPGVHPGFLISITEHDTDPTWDMYKSSPKHWRWSFAVGHTAETLTTVIPELVTAISSQIFSGGKNASKAYQWHVALLGREIPIGEEVDLDPLMPLPCQVGISRSKNGQTTEWAIVDALYGWEAGHALLTPELRTKLALWWTMKQAGEATEAPAPAAAPATPQMYARPAAPTQAPAPATPATAGRAAW